MSDDLIKKLFEATDHARVTGGDFAGREAFCPQTPTAKQLEFDKVDAKEALFGGAAGGGKSSALLYTAMKYVHDPRYSALLVRKTYADLSKPGALLDRIQEWVAGTAATYNAMLKRVTFPSGAKISFGHLESANAHLAFQGAEYQMVGVDELTQLPERQYRYLLSRLRRLSDRDTPLRSRNSANPGGPGHQWTYDRFVGPNAVGVYIPSRLHDNPHLDAESYREQLALLDPVTRAQLLDGSWVRDGSNRMWLYDDAVNKGVPDEGEVYSHVIGLDLGASARSATTAWVVLGYHPHSPKCWVIESGTRATKSPSEIAEILQDLLNRYEVYRVVVDHGGLGVGYIEEFVTRHRLPAEAADKRDRLTALKLVNGAFHRGELIVTPGNQQLEQELLQTEWNEKGTDSAPGSPDHLSDALRYAYKFVTSFCWSEKPKPAPKHGTEEWARREEEKMRKAAQQPAKPGRSDWWR